MALFEENNKLKKSKVSIQNPNENKHIDMSSMTDEERIQYYKLQSEALESEKKIIKVDNVQLEKMESLSEVMSDEFKKEIISDIEKVNNVTIEELISVKEEIVQEQNIVETVSNIDTSETITDTNSSIETNKIPEVVKYAFTQQVVNEHVSNFKNENVTFTDTTTTQYNVKETIDGEPIENENVIVNDTIKDDTENETDDSSNLSLTIPLSDRAVYGNTITNIIEQYKDDPESLNKLISNPNSYFNKISNAYNALNADQIFKQKAVNYVDSKDFAQNLTEFKAKTWSGLDSTKIKHENGYIKGETAALLITSKIRGIKRVPLLNSGFYIHIRPFTNYELNEFVNSLYAESAEYGKMFGMHYYLFSDLFVKKFIMDRLPDIVVKSNLEGWKQKNVLLNNIAFPDYNVILWAVASLMYKEGVKYTQVCGKPDCQFTEEVVINLNNLIYNNYKIITEKNAHSLMIKGNDIKPHELKEYRKLLSFDVPNTIEQDGFRFILKIPSLNEYITFADMFYNELIKKCQVTDEIEVQDFLKYNFYCHYAPWIEEIQILDEDNNVSLKINDSATIMDSLSKFEFEGTEFNDKMQDFILKTQVSHIAFNYTACPKCETVPKDVKGGFIAYDIQSAFFTMSVMKLR